MKNSKSALMERQLKRVERWLKRCVIACKCGSWSDALAEAECLEAETKGLREKLWIAAEDDVLSVPNRGVANFLVSVLKTGVLAMAIVLSAVIPIAFDSESGVLEFARQRDSVVLLSSTESDIINALRESLSSGNSGSVIISVERPKETTVAESGRGMAMAAEKAVIEETPQTPVEVKEQTPAVRRPSADEVISLIQVGQRALRYSEPGVIVVP